MPTSGGVDLDEDVVPAGFDAGRHHVLHRRTDRQHQGEGLVVRPVDLIEHWRDGTASQWCGTGHGAEDATMYVIFHVVYLISIHIIIICIIVLFYLYNYSIYYFLRVYLLSALLLSCALIGCSLPTGSSQFENQSKCWFCGRRQQSVQKSSALEIYIYAILTYINTYLPCSVSDIHFLG